MYKLDHIIFINRTNKASINKIDKVNPNINKNIFRNVNSIIIDFVYDSIDKDVSSNCRGYNQTKDQFIKEII